MDVLGVRQMKSKRQGKKRSKEDDVKVVYISSPMMVNTCASKFRALVQELTGKDSDVALQFMDDSKSINGASKNSPNKLKVSPHQQQEYSRAVDDNLLGVPFVEPNKEYSPSRSEDSSFEPFGGHGLLPQLTEGSFMEMLTSNSKTFHSLIY